MGFNINLYTFSKKVNSTARPTSSATVKTCVIKEPCGIISPVIGLNLGLTDNPAAFNYAYIPQFNRYYFIKEWTFQNALWYATLEVDVLASWKDTIGAASCYILRSSAISDGSIMDNLYPATSDTTFSNIIKDPCWETTDIANGTFVVGIAGQNTMFYTFSYNALQLFLQYLLGSSYATDLTNNWSFIFTDLNAQINPLQYITGILWFPFAYSGSSVSTIRVGYVDVPVVAGAVTGSGLVHFSYTFSPPRHPQAIVRGAYLNNAPFSEYQLFFPPFGQIQINPNLIANSSNIETLVSIDLRTGLGTLSILDNTNTVITSWIQTRVALPYQTSQIISPGTFDVAKQVSMIGNLIPSIAAGNPAGIASGIINRGVSAIGDYARSKVPSVTSIGSSGGMSSLRGNPALQCEFKTIVDEDNTHNGRPLCKVRQISTIPGYLQVANAYIEVAATQDERNTIITYMEGGFYYE